jgi:Aerotolerance regulator N-terminal/von Willebrand factor type A domain
MGVLAPWFLAGAAAVALPFYLHLLRRRHPDPRPFGSLMFFDRRSPSSIKQRRLRYLLLLSLRVALLLLLALAFANPFINRAAASAASHKLLLLVIDNSFSMRAGSRLADARRGALSVLASLRPGERAQVMTLGSQIHELTQPTEDLAVLRTAVESIKPGDSRASFGQLARAMRTFAESVRTPIELHLFSDMQKSAMPGNFTEMTLPANVLLVPHGVTRTVEPNWTIESADAPGEIADPKKASVRAVVAGYHTPAAIRTVSLLVNAKVVATQTVTIPANGRATVVFRSPEVPYGLSRCEVKIDSADSLPADDVALFGVERSDPKRVLFVREPGDSRSALYFGAALESADEAPFKLETITVDRVAGIKPSSYAFVVVSDVSSLPAPFEKSLLDYVRHGGGVLVATGTSAGLSSRIPVFGGSVLQTRDYTRDGTHFLTVGETETSHPSIRNADGWSGVKFYFAVGVNDAHAQVIAKLTDQTPLLLEKTIGEGRVLLLASGLDNLTNDFPLHPSFVPFVEETARYLSGLEHRGGARQVDSWVELRASKQPGTAVQVVGPDGLMAFSLHEASSARDLQLTRAGFYEVRRADSTSDLIGVNPDRRESDLGIMPKDVLSLWSGNTSGRERAFGKGPAQDKSQPYHLWWYVMLLALATALAESVLGSRYLQKLQENA